MRLLIHGINYAPEQIGAGKYTAEMAEWLAANGHEVRVVTALPYYPAWRVAEGYSRWKYRREAIEGVNVWRCPLWVPSKPSGLKRILHLLSFALSSLPVMLRQGFWRPDWVIVVEPPFFCAPQAWLTATLSGSKAWLHIQDFEIDAAIALEIFAVGWFRKIMARLECFLMNRFDRVSSISGSMVERLRSKGVKKSTCILFPNWVDTRKIYPVFNSTSIRWNIKIKENEIVALYSGNMNEKQGLEILIDAAERLDSQNRIQIVLCGEGPSRKRLERIAKKRRLKNVHFLRLQPEERLNDLLNMADIHLLPQRADAADLVMPSKLTAMMASGRPVIATAEPGTEVGEAVVGHGLVVTPGDVAGLVEAAEELASNPEKRNALGMGARRYAKDHWDKEKILIEFQKALCDIRNAN